MSLLQDSGEPFKETSQDSTQPGLPEQPLATSTGNSDIRFHAATQPRHQLPSYPFFNANSSRLYPEWSVPEPVAVPRRANGFWGSSWSQPQHVPATQAAHAQSLPEMVHFQGSALDIPDERTVSGLLEAAPFQSLQYIDTQPVTAPQAAAEQSQAAQPASARPPPHLLPRELVLEQPHHPTTGQASTTQPSSSAARLHQTPASPSAQPPLHDMALQMDAAQSTLPASEPRSANDVPQPVLYHPQQQQQLPGQQQHWVEQQLPHQQVDQQQTEDMQQQYQPPQQLPQQLPHALDQAPGDVGTTNQQPGPGPPDGAAPNVGAYSQRELFLQNMEQAGDMSFEYVLNDGQRHNSIWSVISPRVPHTSVQPLLLSMLMTLRLVSVSLQSVMCQVAQTHTCVLQTMCTAGTSASASAFGTGGPFCQVQLLRPQACLSAEHGVPVAMLALHGLIASTPQSVPVAMLVLHGLIASTPQKWSSCNAGAARADSFNTSKCSSCNAGAAQADSFNTSKWSSCIADVAQVDSAEEHLLKAAAQHAARVHCPLGAGSAASLCGHHQKETKCGWWDHVPSVPQAAFRGDRLLCSHCQ